MNRVELPIVKGFFNANSCIGATSAVAGTVKSIENWYYNHAIQMYCNNIDENNHDLNLCISDTLFWSIPIFDEISYDLFYFKNCIFSIIKSFILHGHYIYFNGLSLKEFADMKTDSGLIIGFEEQNDIIILLTSCNKTMIKKHIKVTSFQDAVNALVTENSPMFHCFKVKSNKSFVFEPKIIKDNLYKYLFPESSGAQVTGIIVYEQIALYIHNCITKNTIIDQTYFDILVEHKSIMCQRAQLLERYYGFDECILYGCKLVKSYCEELRENICNNSNDLEKVTEIINNCKSTEIKTLTLMYKNLEMVAYN